MRSLLRSLELQEWMRMWNGSFTFLTEVEVLNNGALVADSNDWTHAATIADIAFVDDFLALGVRVSHWVQRLNRDRLVSISQNLCHVDCDLRNGFLNGLIESLVELLLEPFPSFASAAMTLSVLLLWDFLNLSFLLLELLGGHFLTFFLFGLDEDFGLSSLHGSFLDVDLDGLLVLELLQEDGEILFAVDPHIVPI